MPQRYLIFIESNTTGSGMQALARAREMQLHPVLLARKPDLYPNAADCLIKACETNDLESVREAIAAVVQGDSSALHGITTTSEFYTEMAAAVAADYGFPANPLTMVQTCRNKARTRQVLTAQGFLQPRFAHIAHEEDLRQALQQVPLPCILKPCSDTGSYGVRLCASLEEAQDHARQLLSQQVNIRGQQVTEGIVCEEYIEGDEFSVETFAWQGHIHPIGITEKRVKGYPYFVEYGHMFPAHLPAEDEQRMLATVTQALECVGNTQGPVHTEVKLTRQGCSIIEINPRLAGGMIPELIWQAKGIDLLKNQLLAACGEMPHLEATRHAWAGILFLTAPRTGVFKAIRLPDQPQAQPDATQLTVTAPPGKAVRPPQSAYDRLGYLILQDTTSYATLATRLEQLEQSIEVLLEPETETE